MRKNFVARIATSKAPHFPFTGLPEWERQQAKRNAHRTNLLLTPHPLPCDM